MSDVVMVAAIAALPATLGALLGLMNSGKIEHVKQRVDETDQRLNGRLDAFMALIRKESYQEGVEAEAKKHDH
jgi:hypothetical protein